MTAIKQVNVPDIGNFDAVDVIEINVAPGEQVNKDDALITLESDKASMEVPSPYAGIIKSIDVKVGDKVAEGAAILTIEVVKTERSASSPDTVSVDEKASAQVGSKSVRVPDIGNFDKVDVIEVPIFEGARVGENETLVTLESDKASMDIPSPYAGVVEKLNIRVGDKVSQDDLICEMRVIGEGDDVPAEKSASTPATAAAPTQQPAPVPAAPAQAAAVSGGEHNVASPGVRRLARELGIALAQVPASGRHQRVTKDDLNQFIKQQMQSGSGGGLALEPMPDVDFAAFGPIETQDLSRINKLSAKYLHRNWVNIPHVTQFDEADITDMEAFRQENKAKAQAQGCKLTPLVFLMKAVVGALKVFPRFNASLAHNGEQLVMKKYFHIGVAVDTPNGLVVPVVRDVDRKGIMELAQELKQISAKAREGKLSGKEMQGSCFSISSLGGIGGTAFTPIINAPDVAILGVSKSQMAPVYKDGKFVARLMLPLSLSYDHRVIDGAEAARFTTYLAQALGDLRQLLM